MKQQAFASPGEALAALEHHGVKGMRWGVRKAEDHGSTPSGYVDIGAEVAKQLASDKKLKQPSTSSKETQQTEKHGLTRNQKMLLTFGALTAAGAGYYAYQHYTGGKVPLHVPTHVPSSVPHIPTSASHVPRPGTSIRELAKHESEMRELNSLKIPTKWDVSELPKRPLSTQRLGELAGEHFEAKLKNPESLVINTARGYADILPKDGLSNPHAAEQHASVIRALEHMRDKYPAIRNMNVEVVPMSRVPGLEDHNSIMSVMSMRAGEARVIYNDTMAKPSAAVLEANKDFLPGMGKKDYLAHHEMGHLLAVAHGEFPPSYDILVGNAGSSLSRTWGRAEELRHKQTFVKHGFTFKELSKLSGYAATTPMEAMAELHGHLMTPEMRARLTPDQITRAEAMFNEMGGLTTG
jgi:hypothetical protein